MLPLVPFQLADSQTADRGVAANDLGGDFQVGTALEDEAEAAADAARSVEQVDATPLWGKQGNVTFGKEIAEVSGRFEAARKS